MKELLLQLAGYHLWANEVLLQLITQLPEDKHHREIPSSFSSLFSAATLVAISGGAST